MPNLHRLFRKSQLLVVHACASPYRERSHFDGQDVLESGVTKPGTIDTKALLGWKEDKDLFNEGVTFADQMLMKIANRDPGIDMAAMQTQMAEMMTLMTNVVQQNAVLIAQLAGDRRI